MEGARATKAEEAERERRALQDRERRRMEAEEIERLRREAEEQSAMMERPSQLAKGCKREGCPFFENPAMVHGFCCRPCCMGHPQHGKACQKEPATPPMPAQVQKQHLACLNIVLSACLDMRPDTMSNHMSKHAAASRDGVRAARCARTSHSGDI